MHLLTWTASRTSPPECHCSAPSKLLETHFETSRNFSQLLETSKLRASETWAKLRCWHYRASVGGSLLRLWPHAIEAKHPETHITETHQKLPKLPPVSHSARNSPRSAISHHFAQLPAFPVCKLCAFPFFLLSRVAERNGRGSEHTLQSRQVRHHLRSRNLGISELQHQACQAGGGPSRSARPARKQSTGRARKKKRTP